MKRNGRAYIWPCLLLATVMGLGLYCVLSPNLAKDIARAHVMMSGQPEYYHDWPRVDAALHIIGAALMLIAAIIMAAYYLRRK